MICDRRDRGVDSVLYTILHASKHGRKRRDVAFFYSFNQSIRELRFHLFGFGYIHVMIYVKLRTDVMWDYLIGLKERIRPTPAENQGGIYRLDGKYT